MTPWKRREVIGDCTLYLGDCLDVLPALGKADAVVTDPPYGIGEAAGKNASRTKPRRGREQKMPGKTIVARDFGREDWDDEPLDDVRLELILRAGKWNIIFGGNYYSLPPSRCWLVWDKLNGESDFADCELAWTNLPGAVRRIRHMWNGMLREGMEPRGFHPTQKPLRVMQWCLERLPAGVSSILDPLMGSGTTGVACVRTGLSFIGVEKNESYFDIACQRISRAYAQPDMFIEAAKPSAEQLSMLDGKDP